MSSHSRKLGFPEVGERSRPAASSPTPARSAAFRATKADDVSGGTSGASVRRRPDPASSRIHHPHPDPAAALQGVSAASVAKVTFSVAASGCTSTSASGASCSGSTTEMQPSAKWPGPTAPSPSLMGSGASKSKWQRLLSAFRKNHKNVSVGGGCGVVENYRLKHSHNCSNSLLRAGISNMKGYKKANQDRCTAFSYLEGDPELAYFAIYDGHGGTGVANYLKDHLHEFILKQPEYQRGNMEEAIVKAFLQVDEELRTYGSATELTGSTATAILIKHGDLYCANLGDSRAVACVMGLVKPLSSDHNTGNPKERERVYSMGGVIKDNRVGGVLIPTRSFGDFLLKSEHEKPPWKQVISAVPQIESFKVTSHWDFVVVGSDGVWDAMSNQEMISYIRAQLSDCTTLARREKLVLSELCEQILDLCCSKTVGHYGKNSCDNMTIIIIWFDHGDLSETGSSVVSSCVSR